MTRRPPGPASRRPAHRGPMMPWRVTGRAVAVSQSPEERFREYLASRPVPKRFTGQQREMLAHIFARHSHFDTDQLIEDLKKVGSGVSRATIYRTLGELVKAGLLKKIEIGPRRPS